MTTTYDIEPDDNDGTLYVEVTLPDGSVARWARTPPDGAAFDDYTLDSLTDAIERILGSPDTLLC